MSAIDLTRRDLVRALTGLARAAADAAMGRRAEALAGRIAAAGIATEVVRRGPGDYAVTASAPGLFGREFGSVDAPPDPVVGAAVEAMTARTGK